jgi:hypothetical protein
VSTCRPLTPVIGLGTADLTLPAGESATIVLEPAPDPTSLDRKLG